MKFQILEGGIDLSPEALNYINEANLGRALTPADYASTSGIIMRLEDDVWVNAPIATYNENFVDAPQVHLVLGPDGLVARFRAEEVRAGFWLSPAYHDQSNASGTMYSSVARTHADRVRVSPVAGCAYGCRFCNWPFEFRYHTKDIDFMIEAVGVALADPVQPAGHVLVSGGAPRPDDFAYLQESYTRLLAAFPNTPIDIMMVPMDGLLDAAELTRLGVNELSINVEIYDPVVARPVMRRKYGQGVARYLSFIENATAIMGPGRVRSMLMVGIEDQEQTLAGVRAIAERGGVPVLSPFRPDPKTPMASAPVPTAQFLQDTYQRAHDITRGLGGSLGPSCVPCGHNTLTFAGDDVTGKPSQHAVPRMV